MIHQIETASHGTIQHRTTNRLWLMMMGLAVIFFALELFFNVSFPLSIGNMVSLSLDAVFVILLVLQ